MWLLDLLGLLYYSTIDREAYTKGVKLSAAHCYAHKVFYCVNVSKQLSVRVVFTPGRLTISCFNTEKKITTVIILLTPHAFDWVLIWPDQFWRPYYGPHFTGLNVPQL